MGYTLTWPIPTTSNDEAIADLFAGWAAVRVLNDPGALLGLADYRELIAKSSGCRPPWRRGTVRRAMRTCFGSITQTLIGTGRSGV